jgi:thymidine phosphorylase
MVIAAVGDEVRTGDPILELRYRDRARLEHAIGRASAAITIGDTRPAPAPLLVGEVH